MVNVIYDRFEYCIVLFNCIESTHWVDLLREQTVERVAYQIKAL